MAINGDNGEMEKELWESAEKLRGPVEPAEYKHVVLGLLFLKYMSDAFEKRRAELEELTRDPESSYYCGDDEEERQYILSDGDEYYSENVLYVPEEARWQELQDNATSPQIGTKVDEAMRTVEEENPEQLKGMMYKRYSRIPQDTLEGLLNQLADINIGKEDEDTFGRVYEYFIKEFARNQGQDKGEFYTPKPVVELLVEILEPFEGRIFDPFCGSGGMFIQSKELIENNNKDDDRISAYGQELKQDIWRICKMNLYMRGIEGDIRQGHSISDNQHKGLKADYVITNPPFNMKEWGRNAVAEDDPRFKYGMPPVSKQGGNFAFMEHMIQHTADDGVVGTVMAKGSLSTGGDSGKIRKNLVEDDLVDAIIVLSDQLFYTTEIPVCLWVLSMSKGEKTDSERVRNEETLFIDARDIYEQKEIKQKILTPEQIDKIAGTVRAYREDFSEYEDVDGYCKVADIDEIADNDYSLIPGRYVGVEEIERDGIPFDTKMEELTSKLRDNFRKSDELQEEIDEKLREVRF